MSVSAQKSAAVRALEAELGCCCIHGQAKGCVSCCRASGGGADIWGIGNVAVWGSCKFEKGRRESQTHLQSQESFEKNVKSAVKKTD